MNELSNMETQYNLKQNSLNTSTFWGIYTLHEFGHFLKKYPDDTGNIDASKGYTGQVIRDCFKGLLK